LSSSQSSILLPNPPFRGRRKEEGGRRKVLIASKFLARKDSITAAKIKEDPLME